MTLAFLPPLSLAQRHPHRTSHLSYRQLAACVETPPKPARVAFNPDTSALREGIKSVAIGKHGTKPVPAHLFPKLTQELSQPEPPDSLLLQKASFLAALFVKRELLPEEHSLLRRFTHSPQHISGRERVVHGRGITAGEVLAAVSRTQSPLTDFAKRLLDDERLDFTEAATLGELLYAPGGDQCVKALIAHVMRVRHESSSELAGLCVAAANGASNSFTKLRGKDGGVYVHLAEPFDGTVTYELLTPVLCNHLLKRELKPVMAVGESSGPKYGPNLRDVVDALGMETCSDAEEIVRQFEEGAKYGVAVDQRDAQVGLSQWVNMRRTIVKRPAIATVEKYVDACPEKAKIFIGSAFHPPYVGKMADSCEAAGYDGYIVVGKGMEGSLGLGIQPRRTADLVVGWKRVDGYERETVKYSAIEDGLDTRDEPERFGATAQKTAERIVEFVNGRCRDELFGRRARATLNAFDRALAVLEREGVLNTL